MSKGFVVDRSINFLELEETIYDRTSIDRSEYAIEITHKPVGDIFGDTATPTLISNESDIIDLMFLYKEKQGMTLHVIIKEKCDKGKAIYVYGDDDLNNDGGDALGFHDDYFGCRINEEIPFVTRFGARLYDGQYNASTTLNRSRGVGITPCIWGPTGVHNVGVGPCVCQSLGNTGVESLIIYSWAELAEKHLEIVARSR
ncbi:hypothetical protein TIFTF001_054465 [Ficus carica]|uniref:Uncharacterized protein n=1 Tax=Ficus carica TaxID=3494 RepID=A0AA88EH41_FICCA|nr:hypothetical protein TIFTF001_054465 [Ficus carica]